MVVASQVAFELETFEWADERLEVAGRWRGVGSRRLSRPVLTVECEGTRRKRVVGLPGGQFGGSGESWRASFSWPGDPGDITGAALEVDGNLVVDLPLPDRKRRRRRRSTQETGSDEALRGEVGALRAQIERLRGELAGREREITALHEQLDAARGHDPAADRAAPDDHTVEITQLESELARVREDHAAGERDLTVEIERLSRERDDAHSAAAEAVAAERERWQEELTELRVAFAEAAAEAEATREAHDAEIDSLERQLRAERAEVARLLTRIAEHEERAAAAAAAPMPPPAGTAPEPTPATPAPEPTDPMPRPPGAAPEPTATADTVPDAAGAVAAGDTEETDVLRAAEQTRTVSRVPAWLRSSDDPDDEAPRPSKLATWLRGGEPVDTEPDTTPDDARVSASLREEAVAPDAHEDDPPANGSAGPPRRLLGPDALAGLREKLLGRREAEPAEPDDDSRVPALPPPIRTRTDARLRGSVPAAPYRNPTEVWTLRVVAAIVVAVLLTAFVLVLAYLA